MKTTYVMRKDRDGKNVLVEKSKAGPPPMSGRSLHVLNDIQPFQSIVDGTTVGSRSQLREHNRRNKCIDIGMDPAITRPRKPYEPQGVEMDVKRAMAQHGMEF